jgi:hypothetical protein
MKIILCIIFLLFSVISLFAQKETFDLITYAAPAEWKKDLRETMVSYYIANPKTNGWCQISIVKSTVSKGSIDQDFASEWQDLIVKNYNPAGPPQMMEDSAHMHDTTVQAWKIKTGTAKFVFNNRDAIALLTTITGYNRCISIITATNSGDYLKDIEAFQTSMDLLAPDSIPLSGPIAVPQNSPGQTDAVNSVLGSWGKSESANQHYDDYKNPSLAYAIGGYRTYQYTFNNDGSYLFVSKIFWSSYDKLQLVRESGTYQVNGSQLTISPAASVLELWSKKDRTDKWGERLSSEKRKVEPVTYQLTFHYFSGLKRWEMILQSEKVTERDGPFSGSSSFPNSWYYSPLSKNNPAIELPEN